MASLQTGTGLYKQVIITETKQEVPGVKTFVLQEQEEKISYKPGQYLTFVHKLNNQEVRRSYSITSSPVLNEPISILVKRIENGFFSRQLVDYAKPGDVLTTTGAGGFFILPENIQHYKQLFFLAAGSGISPIYSLLKIVLYSFPHISAVLIYSNKSPAKTIFRKPLQLLAKQFSNRFQLQFLFSNVKDISKGRLHKDFFNSLLNHYSLAAYKETLFYICGPQSYMRMCTYTLQEADVPKQNIKKEDFAIQRLVPATAMPPDKEPHHVTIKFGGKQYRFQSQYPKSILQTAKEQGFALPYSCETGRCGSCAANCVKGSVWLSYNEVLTEIDIAKGITLTCVGYPVNGDVVLEIG